MDFDGLVIIVKKEFSYLNSTYGFNKVTIRNLGKELYFDFDRSDETVSIYFEFGSHPIIELFVPTDKTNLKPVPWAEKDGITRSRIFSKLNVKLKYDSENVDNVKAYISELAKKFKESNLKWLSA